MRCRTILVGCLVVMIAATSAGCRDDSTSTHTEQSTSTSPLGASGSLPSSEPAQLLDPSAGQSSATPDTSADAGVATPPQSAAIAELQEAVVKITGQNLTFTLNDGLATADGVYDVASGGVSLVRVIDGWRYEVTSFGSDMYLVGLVPGDTVLHIAVDGLSEGSQWLPLAFPLLATRLINGVTEVDASVNSYSGRLDLTTVAPDDLSAEGRFISYLATRAGGSACCISFTATVDGFGRLAGFQIVLPRADGEQDLTYELMIKEIGGSVSVVRPTTGITEAPVSIYAG